MGEQRDRPAYKVLSTKTIVWFGVLLVVVGAGLAAALLRSYGAGTEADKARLDAIRTAGTIVVGTGGVAALWLAARRQQATEIALRQKDADQAHQEQDAAERRVTELYTKAVEQLGSEKAPVRLGGMYALERLAQNAPDQRQTIVNVLCSYLRMPFQSPIALDAVPAESTAAKALIVPQQWKTSAVDGNAEPIVDRDENERRIQEREVRLTAQRIITEHLHPQYDAGHPADTFWEHINLDLTGATLIALDLHGCRVGTAQFDGAKFERGAGFIGMTFEGGAMFAGAKFEGDAAFVGVMFEGIAVIDEVTFMGDAGFDGTTFKRVARFDEVTFGGLTGFNGATFEQNAVFGGATFGGFGGFDGATFQGNAGFDGATFEENAVFGGATFGGIGGFDGATFQGNAGFDEATFEGFGGFGGAKFMGAAGFGGAKFIGDAVFDGATFRGFGGFSRAAFEAFAGFVGVTFERVAGFVEVMFTGDAGFDGTTFEGVAMFGRATFEGDVRFDRVIFKGPTVFDNARVRIDVVETTNRNWPVGFSVTDPGSPQEAVIEGRNGEWGYLTPVCDGS
ncbi:pentapeptide repeat-containing protein [Actinosynnema sp. NPDC023794]